MENKEDSNIIIEGNTALWELKQDGDINGTYTGSFRFRCYLVPSQRLAASREYRELLGPHANLALNHDDNLAFALTQLKYRVISSPPFWTSSLSTTLMAGDLPDENIIQTILDAAISAELKYKYQLKEKRSEAIQKAKRAAEKLLNERDEEDHEGEDKEDAD